MAIHAPIRAHRLSNYAQVYESMKSLSQLYLAREMIDPCDDSPHGIDEKLAMAEIDFYEAIRAFNETNLDDPDRPVSINGAIYLALFNYEHEIIRVEPLGLRDLADDRTWQLKEDDETL